MSQKTIIAWTERTWNPWRGCTKVSPGCKNCYMFTAQSRYGRNPAEVVRTKTWGNPAKWQREAEAAGRTERVFTCSWSDWFHEDADPWREEAWAVIRSTPNLTYQILTKRPELIAERLPADWGDGYPNVWLGVSVESDRYYDRLRQLMAIPATIRFVSAEPLLGPLDLRPWLMPAMVGVHPRLDWVIVGGESGPGYRPMELDWARTIKEHCREFGVAFFFKQSAAPRTEMGTQLDGEMIREYPTGRIALATA